MFRSVNNIISLKIQTFPVVHGLHNLPPLCKTVDVHIWGPKKVFEVFGSFQSVLDVGHVLTDRLNQVLLSIGVFGVKLLQTFLVNRI